MKLNLLLEYNYEYGIVMIIPPDELIQKVKKIDIPDKNLYVDSSKNIKGREDDTHITVKYGIKEISPTNIRKLTKDFGPIDIKATSTSLFKNEEYDVFKINIVSEKLHKLFKILKDNTDNVESFPTYKPHITIAYVNKNSVNDKIKFNYSFTIDELLFVNKSGKKFKIKL